MINTLHLLGLKSDFEGIRYFVSNDGDFKINEDYAIVESDYGYSIGQVLSIREFTKEELQRKEDTLYSPIIRKADLKDIANLQKQREQTKNDKVRIQTEANSLNLSMKVLNCYYTIDYSKLLIVYTSEDKVDFRDLLKILRTIYPQIKIELRQIGFRDKAKIIGGVGICGLPICCSNFLRSFDGITINLAKNQNLSLNNSKISGQCGKFICCLKYENDLYTELKKGFPLLNEETNRNNKNYKITSINYLTGVITLQVDSTNIINISLEDYNDLKFSHKNDDELISLSTRFQNRLNLLDSNLENEKVERNTTNPFESKYFSNEFVQTDNLQNKQTSRNNKNNNQQDQTSFINKFRNKNQTDASNNKQNKQNKQNNNNFKQSNTFRNNNNNSQQSQNKKPSAFDRFKKKDNKQMKQGYLGNINDKK